MPNFLLTWLATAVAIVITAYIVPGFNVADFVAAAIAAIVLGFVNAIIRPLLILLTLPLTVLTLGLFLLVINAITLSIVGLLVPGFNIIGFLPALVGSVVLTIVASVLNFIARRVA